MENEKIKYIVKPEEKLVIGIYKSSWPELWDSFTSQMNPRIGYMVRTLIREHLSYDTSITIRAFAKCSDGDVFDEEFGKKLVEAKIYKKLHYKVADMIICVMKDMYHALYHLDSGYKKHYDVARNIERDIRDYFYKQ